MKAPLFEFPSYQYEVSDWEFKKKALFNRINKSSFVRTSVQTFESDRMTCEKSYVNYLTEFLRPELDEFCQEAQVSCTMTDAWAVRYQKGDHQCVHNHRGWGFSGILYVEYEPKVHTPTFFVAPWNDPRSDTTSLTSPKNVRECTLFIAPSWALHFINPNQTRKIRTVVVFDLLPDLTEHPSLNKNV